MQTLQSSFIGGNRAKAMAHPSDGGSARFRTGAADESVLLVSDSTDEREMYAAGFQLYGFRILYSCTADEAYRVACDLSPAVVITDIRLAGPEDGLELTRRLKRNAATRATPVVVLTAETVTVGPLAALSSGCDLLVLKPCLPDALSVAAQELIARAPVGAPEMAHAPILGAPRPG